MASCRSGKSQRDLIFDCLTKLFAKLVKNQEKHAKVMNQWQNDFDTMARDGYFTPGLPWPPWPAPTAKQGVCPRVDTAGSSVHDISSVVPTVLHPGWTAKDRERAEV